MYTGETIRHAVQGGHTPGAINIVSLDGVEGQSQTWRSAEELEAMHKDIPKDKTVYLYCHDGFRLESGRFNDILISQKNHFPKRQAKKRATSLQPFI